MRLVVRDLRAVLGNNASRLPALLSLMLAAAFLDLAGISLIAPFLSIALALPAPGIPSWLAASDVRWIGAALVVVFGLKGWLAFRVQERITLTSETVRSSLMTRLLSAYQQRPYSFHLQRNSTDLVNTVLWHTQAFTGAVLGSLLQMAANGLVFIAIAGLLLMSSPVAFAALAALLTVAFVVVATVVRPRLSSSFRTAAAAQAGTIQSVTQSLSALREIRILGREAAFLSRMQQASALLARSAAQQASLQQVPRQSIEFVVVLFLVGLAWAFRSSANAAALVPLLATFGAAALRLLPASTSLLSSFNLFRANRFAIRVLAEELVGLDEGARADASHQVSELAGFRSLQLDQVSFAYEGSEELALEEVNLRIEAGDILGVMGRSGAGKSTLADLVLGLLSPTCGRVLVDGLDIRGGEAAWQRLVAYIPQSVTLVDDTLRRNVALGASDAEIDDSKVANAIAMAQLEELVERLPNGLDTMVGERGVRLSGGQRQRVAIARALYYDREFLVFDEATSALDDETETQVVAAISLLAGRKTMVVIAHRMSTLRPCTRLVRMEQGRLVMVDEVAQVVHGA